MFGRRYRLQQEMWDELRSYSRNAAKFTTLEEATPIYSEQLACARRLYQANPREFSSLMGRAIRSSDPLTLALGLQFTVRLKMPKARELFEATLHRLETGEQHLQPFELDADVRAAPEGSTHVQEMVAALRTLEPELDR